MSWLPDFDALTSEQDEVLDRPLDESLIVTGAPGTGKTVMALYRARMLTASGRPTLLLMFGKLLSSYTTASVKAMEIDGVVSTYHAWFPRFWRDTYGELPPKINQWTFDWAACKARIMRDPEPLTSQPKLNVIIDEGQDMPQDFYLLMTLLSINSDGVR